MRVLLAAFACEPGRGSEPGAGWAFAATAARNGWDVTLVTQPRFRRGIEAARRADPALERRLHPVYCGLPAPVMSLWERHGKLRGLQLYYLMWQVALRTTATRLHRRQRFSVAHHVTLAADWAPSGLAFVRGLPLVWGPLGGGERVPEACRPWLGRRGRTSELLRRVTTDPLWSLFGAAAARRSRLLVAQNEQEAVRLATTGRPVVVRPNVVLEAEPLPSAFPGQTPGAGRRVAVFAGRLLGWKGVHLAVATISRPELAHWELHLYGEGPERRRLERMAHRSGVADRVVLHGARPRQQVRAAMASADVFLYPSMREAAGWAVAEALAAGCPVVCLDAAGPPLLLRPAEAGEAVEPGSDLDLALAQAVLRAEGSPRRAVLWDDRDLPALLDGWYRRATQSETGGLRPEERPPATTGAPRGRA